MIALALLFSTLAHAALIVPAGTYQAVAMIINSPSGPEALFNARTRSELHLSLKGPKAEALRAELGSQHATVRKIKFRITTEVRTGRGEAVLDATSIPKDGERPARFVGNRLQPEAK